MLVSVLAIAKEPGDGSTPSGLAVVKKNETTFNLIYQSAGFVNVKVSILNKAGKEVHTDYIKKTKGFVKPYNFEKMNVGEYTVTVFDGETTQTEKFTYDIKHEPKAAKIVSLADNKFLLAIKGNMVSGKVTVKIFDGSRLIHEQFNEINSDFGEVFNLKSISQGISFEVTDSDGNKIN